jgi:hypothetical protein
MMVTKQAHTLKNEHVGDKELFEIKNMIPQKYFIRKYWKTKLRKGPSRQS